MTQMGPEQAMMAGMMGAMGGPPPPEQPGTQLPEAQEGQGSDTILGHLTAGEVVIPVELMDDPTIRKNVERLFTRAKVEINPYIVGDVENNINPETGNPEFRLHTGGGEFTLGGAMGGDIQSWAPGTDYDWSVHPLSAGYLPRGSSATDPASIAMRKAGGGVPVHESLGTWGENAYGEPTRFVTKEEAASGLTWTLGGSTQSGYHNLNVFEGMEVPKGYAPKGASAPPKTKQRKQFDTDVETFKKESEKRMSELRRTIRSDEIRFRTDMLLAEEKERDVGRQEARGEVLYRDDMVSSPSTESENTKLRRITRTQGTPQIPRRPE